MNSISDKKIERQCFAIKIFRVMRLCLLFLALSLTQVFASVSYSQSVSVSLQMKNVSIEEVLNQIEEETEFRFLYNKKMVNVEREVNVSANNKNIVEILDNLFKNAGISYSISGRQIVLNKRDATEAIQQTRKVIGVVFDSQGEPVIGANVVEKGTTNGTITDVDGAFTLDVSANAVLKVSYIGYADQEVAVNNKNSLEVRLAENTELIDEVVVVGYGTQKKATVTGSVAQISGEVVKQSPAANLSNSIAGRIPGVVANNRSGEPGSDASEIYIRGKGTLGNNSPLYVIDGVANRGGIDRLNPNDIESISVLKDASASIYGAQAANGVILVTTKRGTDSKPVISYDGNFSVSQNTRTPHLMDAYQYMVYDDEANKYLGRDQIWANIKGGYLDGSIDPLQYANTDWFDATFRNFAPQTQHSLSVRGGNDRVKYYISGGYLYQEPGFKNTNMNFNTLQVRSNLDAKITKDLTVTLELATRQENRNQSNFTSSEFFYEAFSLCVCIVLSMVIVLIGKILLMDLPDGVRLALYRIWLTLMKWRMVRCRLLSHIKLMIPGKVVILGFINLFCVMVRCSEGVKLSFGRQVIRKV